MVIYQEVTQLNNITLEKPQPQERHNNFQLRFLIIDVALFYD